MAHWLVLLADSMRFNKGPCLKNKTKQKAEESEEGIWHCPLAPTCRHALTHVHLT